MRTSFPRPPLKTGLSNSIFLPETKVSAHSPVCGERVRAQPLTSSFRRGASSRHTGELTVDARLVLACDPKPPHLHTHKGRGRGKKSQCHGQQCCLGVETLSHGRFILEWTSLCGVLKGKPSSH
ncbi:unnamed protein product [Rangifer tarandus platyrhynchus]|uniref:Uncharacterized protein n=1 Tax=Rangifer tarandus platyrhynchus TaxID=3082113 RepID=A0AC60A352_RANTA